MNSEQFSSSCSYSRLNPSLISKHFKLIGLPVSFTILFKFNNLILFYSRLGVRACVVLVPLLGVTWLFGFLLPLHIAFSYIFVILNSTQVLFYSVCCTLNFTLRVDWRFSPARGPTGGQALPYKRRGVINRNFKTNLDL